MAEARRTSSPRQQVEAGADVIQVFDSWAGALSVQDYRQFCLAPTTQLIQNIRSTGRPRHLLRRRYRLAAPTMRETGADVLGLDWRIPARPKAGSSLGRAAAPSRATSTPSALFAPQDVLEARVEEVLRLRPPAAPATSSTSATASYPAPP